MFNLRCFIPVSLLLWLTFWNLYADRALTLAEYRTACQQAANDNQAFSCFRKHPAIIYMLDNIPNDIAHEYVQNLVANYLEVRDKMAACSLNDTLGDPILWQPNPSFSMSPTTLQYINLACEIEREFGDLKDKHLLEIGGGYGGLCRILSLINGFASYTIFNYPECNQLAERYLKELGVKNVHFIDSTKFPSLIEHSYDLVLSNYTFSHYKSKKQVYYMDKLLKNIPRGYLTYDFSFPIIDSDSPTNHQSKALNQCVNILFEQGYRGKTALEMPAPHESNMMLTWNKFPCLARADSYPGLSLLPSPYVQTCNALTYSFSGGRLGDNLIAYLHAKWISYKMGLPLIYQPFPYSDHFQLHQIEQADHPLLLFANRSIIVPSNQHEIYLHHQVQSICWLLPYYPECISDHKHPLPGLSFPYFQVNWEDPTFRKEIKRCLAPLVPFNLSIPPKTPLTVAVHVRKGGGFDPSFIHLFFPLKFPPDHYYIEQIEHLAALYKDRELYVFIFTDDPCPSQIVNTYQQALNNPRIHLACKEDHRNTITNPLEDFYSLLYYDCLIRPASNFSLVAGKLTDYQMEIAPAHCHWKEEKIHIDQIEITFRGAKRCSQI